jgi:hypothetical protein
MDQPSSDAQFAKRRRSAARISGRIEANKHSRSLVITGKRITVVYDTMR